MPTLAGQQVVTVDYGGGDVHQLSVSAAGLGSEHLEGEFSLVAWRSIKMPFALDHGAAPERAFQVLELGETSQDDLDRVWQLAGIGVGDVGENAALCRLAHKHMVHQFHAE